MRASILLGTVLVLALSGCKDVPKAADSGAAEGAPAGEGGEGGEAEKPAAPLPEAEALLEKSVEASGGREKIAAIESFHFTGKVSAPTLEITGSVETWWKGGDFYMVQTIEGIGTNRSGKQGGVIWTEEPINGLRKLQGQEAEQHSWASSLLLAADWKDYFTEAETVAAREHAGKRVYDVKLTSKSGAELTLTIDEGSNLVVAQAFEVINPMGRTPVTMELDDYREVDGIKVPFKQRSDLSVLQLTQEITKLELDVDVDASKFAMPLGDTEVVEGRPAEEPSEAPEKPADAPEEPSEPPKEK